MVDKFTNINADNAIIDSLTRFQGFYENVYRDPFIGGKAFIFVTKPLLFLEPQISNRKSYSEMAYLNMTRDPIFTQYLFDQIMNDADKEIINMLSFNPERFSSSFLPMFTNECKNFDSSDTTIEQTDTFDTKQGFKEVLPTHTTTSEAASTLSISVTEDSNLSFTKLMTLWVNYIKNITDGTFDANPDMILNGVLDYTCSIFYFVLSPDGRTLKYWAKYTGCWPTNIPYSSLRYQKGQEEITDVSLNFVYNIKEDMNPKILEEFNMLSFRILGYENPDLLNKNFYNVMQNKYSSIKESPLLTMKGFHNNTQMKNIVKSKERDPIVVYVPGNSNNVNTDVTQDHFELLFGDSGYESSLISDIMKDDEGGTYMNYYYLNDKGTNFIKDIESIEKMDDGNSVYTTRSWKNSEFWAEEVIE